MAASGKGKVTSHSLKRPVRGNISYTLHCGYLHRREEVVEANCGMGKGQVAGRMRRCCEPPEL